MSYLAARFQLVDLIVRGVDSALSLRIEQNGAAVTPSAVTVSVYRPDGSALVSAAVVTPGATSSYTVAAATTTAEALGDAWRVEWTATVSAVPTVFRNEAALVRTKLFPVITDTDLYNIASGLDPTSPTALTSETTYAQWRDEAWNQINGRIIGQGQRPWLVMSPVAVRDAHLYLTLALIFEDLATRLNEAYEMRAASYRRHYEAAWTRLNFRYDADEQGQLVDDDRRRSSRGPTFLSGGAALMAVLTRTALRQRIQAAVDAVTGLTVSAFAPELFGSDTAREMAGRFSVGLGVSEPAPQDRQVRTAEGVYCQTPVTVRIAHKLRADAQVADLDAASTVADAAMVGVMAPGNLANCQIYFVRASQELTPQAEFVLSTLDFLVYHRIPTV